MINFIYKGFLELNKLENAPDGNKAFILLTFPNGQRCAVKKSEITFGI